MARRDIRRYSAARSEFGAPFLNGAQKSVNRKVQGSNPCSGAKPVYENCLWAPSAAAALVGEVPPKRETQGYLHSTEVRPGLITEAAIASEADNNEKRALPRERIKAIAVDSVAAAQSSSEDLLRIAISVAYRDRVEVLALRQS